MIKRVTKTFTASPSYVSVSSSGTLKSQGGIVHFPNADSGDYQTQEWTYYYSVESIKRGYNYSAINISSIPKNATIVSASLSYSLKGGTYGTTRSSVSLRDYGSSATAANIKNALDSMTVFSSLRLTFSYLLNGGEYLEISSKYDDEVGETLTASVTFSSIKLTVTYEYEAGDSIYYGNGDRWVQCNAYYGKDDAWIPIHPHIGKDDGWSGT